MGFSINKYIVTKNKMEEKIKTYTIDFGDTPLITTSIDDVIGLIKTEVEDLKDEDEELQYNITVKFRTQKEIDELPEWS